MEKLESLAMVQYSLHDPAFSHFDNILACDRHRHRAIAYTVQVKHCAVQTVT